MPINDIETYRQKELNLQDPARVAKAGPENVGKLKRDMASFRGMNPHLFQGSVPTTTGEPGQSLDTPEGIDAGTPFAKAQGASEIAELDRQEKLRTDKSAIKSGYSIDLTQDQTPVIEGVRQDPQADLALAKIAEATRDDALPNASKLKVFADPPDYEPKSPPKLDPLSPLASKPKRDSDMWHEPTVEEFRGALIHGSLRNKLKQEFPGIEDPSKLIDKDLESSRSFHAFQDMAWRHALSQAMKEGRPIHRVAFSATLSPEEKSLAQGFDTASGAAGGALQAITLGAFDPLTRASDPEGAERNRQARLRSPKAEMAGELGGSLVGGPAALAKGAAGALGKKLGTEGLGAVATGIASGATTGAADTTLRQIAQGTADALDAGDTAVEALKRVYQTLNPGAIAMGAGMGAGGGLAGELAGAGARGAAKAIVGMDDVEPVLQRNLVSGGKMTATGNVELEPRLQQLKTAANVRGVNADDVLAEDAVDPIATGQLLRTESARRAGQQETAVARERLKEPAVVNGSMAAESIMLPTRDVADKIEAYTKSMPKATNEGIAKIRKLRSIASRLRQMRQLDAEGLDREMAGLDAAAKNRGLGDPDPDLLAASSMLRDLRDEFKFPDTTEVNTTVDNFAIRDPEGNVKVVSDYSGMKARQYKEMSKQAFENEQLGLPRDLQAEPMELGKAPGEDELVALAEGRDPKVELTSKQRDTARGAIKSFGSGTDPTKVIRSEVMKEAAGRAGKLGNLEDIVRLRDRQDYKQLLGKAFGGISVGPGRLGNKYLSSTQLLRGVPSLKTLSGGLPRTGKPTVEASDDLVRLVDKVLDEAKNPAIRGQYRDRIVDEMVPEIPGGSLFHLRGGQGARAAGAMGRQERDPGPELTEEERDIAIAVIKNLQALQGDERKAQ